MNATAGLEAISAVAGLLAVVVLLLSRNGRVQAARIAGLRATVTELSTANTFKDDVVAMISHDLRQPLTSSAGFCEVVLEAWDQTPDEGKKHMIERARRGVMWSSDLLDDILAMAKLDHQRAVAVAVELDVAIALGVAVDRLASDAVSVDTDLVAAHRALVDGGHFQQILGNLLGNAIKYGESPVSVMTRHVAERVLIDVIDSGQGVPEAFVPRLFERFTRAESGNALHKKGTGLGLHIARTLAEANGGTLTYRPATGRGARFTLTLPAAPGPCCSADPVFGPSTQEGPDFAGTVRRREALPTPA